MNSEEKTDLLSELVSYLEKQDAVFSLDGPLMVTIKQKDNTWRKKSLHKSDYYLSSVYVAKTDVIFCFQPEEITDVLGDAQHIEIPSKDMDTAFPLFLDAAIKWAREKFTPIDASRVQPINSVTEFRGLLNMVFNYADLDKQQEESEIDNSLASLPYFGMF